jgi:hypothetical protein
MAITAMYQGGNGKKKSRMLLYPTSLKRPVFHRKKERPGHD